LRDAISRRRPVGRRHGQNRRRRRCRPPPTEPPNPLADLVERRERLQAELGRLAAVGQARADAQAKLAAIGSEAAAIDAEDAAAWAQWAQEAQGEPPRPLSERRQDLERRRILAASEVASAVLGASAVEPRIAALHVEIAEVSEAIFVARLDIALARARQIHVEFTETAAKLRDQAARLNGFENMLIELRGSPMRDRAGIAAALQHTATVFSELKQPPLGRDASTLAKYTAEWKRGLE